MIKLYILLRQIPFTNNCYLLFLCDLIYNCSTFSRAQGVRLKNFKLDLIEGS